MRYTPWPVRDRARTREALARRTGQRRASVTGEGIVLAVEEVVRTTVIGETLLLRQDVDEALLGYALRRDRWNRGLAAEAVGTAVEASFEFLGLHRISAVVVPANGPSIDVLHELGSTAATQRTVHTTFEPTAAR